MRILNVLKQGILLHTVFPTPSLIVDIRPVIEYRVSLEIALIDSKTRLVAVCECWAWEGEREDQKQYEKN